MNRCLTLACVLFASLPCSAQPIAGATRLVAYGDLDLSTTRDRKVLHRRLEQALNQVCLDPSGPAPAGTIDPTCKSDGWRAVRPQVAFAVAQAAAKNAVAWTRTPIRVSDTDGRRSSH